MVNSARKGGSRRDKKRGRKPSNYNTIHLFVCQRFFEIFLENQKIFYFVKIVSAKLFFNFFGLFFVTFAKVYEYLCHCITSLSFYNYNTIRQSICQTLFLSFWILFNVLNSTIWAPSSFIWYSIPLMLISPPLSNLTESFGLGSCPFIL